MAAFQPFRAGKVLSLHNGDGRVLWQLDFGATAPTRLVQWLIPTDPEEGVEVGGLLDGASAVSVSSLASAGAGYHMNALFQGVIGGCTYSATPGA